MILDLLFPRTCVGCPRIGVYICSECLNKVKLRHETICPECAKPSVFGRTHSKCVKPRGLDGLWVGFEYKGLIKNLLSKFKYKYVFDVTETLVELIVSLPDWQAVPVKEWLIVPVPLHQSRVKERGFNQSALLAKHLAKYLNCHYSDKLLIRHKKTIPQMQLKRSERLTNLIGAFTYIGPKKALANVNILLVDDVWTTGATLRELAKVLKRAGAKSVWGLVIAR